MTQKVPHRCKVCGAERVAEYDTDCPIQDFNAWQSMLTCNRCYRFIDSWNRACEIVNKCAADIIAARYACKSSSRQDELRTIEANTRGILTACTKRAATVVSEYYGTMNIWDSSVVEQILEQPKRWRDTLNHILEYAKEENGKAA